MRILAIGGAVIKTDLEELKEITKRGLYDVLIHNGGSLFHDFQRATETLESHSFPLDFLIDNKEPNREASKLVWDWIKDSPFKGLPAPDGSVTRLCEDMEIPVLVFTILGADFWQLFDDDWEAFARMTKKNFKTLCDIMKNSEFHFVNMGSAVIMPEVFTKALAVAKPKKFRADVVDFLDMYRPKTRVAKYGNYYKMDHKFFLQEWIRYNDMGKDIFYER